MMLKLQKRLAADVLKCSEKRITFDPARLNDIKEAITKTDIRLLVGEGAISEKQKKGVSRSRANKIKTQKSKGLRKGQGSRKGKPTARVPKKETWMKRVRAQRRFIRKIKENGLIDQEVYKDIYRKSKGGFFRSISHMKIYLVEKKIFTKKE
jgi:large subunit ribosomal protein L19e